MQGFLIASFINPLLCQHIRDTCIVVNDIFNSHSWTEISNTVQRFLHCTSNAEDKERAITWRDVAITTV